MICGGDLRRADPDRLLMLGAERPDPAKNALGTSNNAVGEPLSAR
jgi:hypothetical protein